MIKMQVLAAREITKIPDSDGISVSTDPLQWSPSRRFISAYLSSSGLMFFLPLIQAKFGYSGDHDITSRG